MKITLAVRAWAQLRERPLVFGDTDQIWAVSILDMLAELQKLYAELPERSEECPDCRGKGETQCGECGHHTDCHHCGGSGKIVLDYDEDAWIDADHLRKHLTKLRAEVS